MTERYKIEFKKYYAGKKDYYEKMSMLKNENIDIEDDLYQLADELNMLREIEVCINAEERLEHIQETLNRKKEESQNEIQRCKAELFNNNILTCYGMQMRDELLANQARYILIEEIL